MICRVLERGLEMWHEGKFNTLVQEAMRCDRPFQRHSRSSNKDHVERVFTRLMLQGKIRAAVRWLTERSKGSVLNPNDKVIVSVECTNESVSVVEAKHPNSHPPHSSTLLISDNLPHFEDVEVTGTHIGLIARRIQSSVGIGGCDSSHWQDALFTFGSHRLLTCHVNSPTPL